MGSVDRIQLRGPARARQPSLVVTAIVPEAFIVVIIKRRTSRHFNNHDAAGLQNPMDMGQRQTVVSDMFQDIQHDYGVDTSLRQRAAGEIKAQQGQIRNSSCKPEEWLFDYVRAQYRGPGKPLPDKRKQIAGTAPY